MTFINKFKKLCLSHWEASFTIFDSCSYELLRSNYTPFASLGVDRWASILGLSLKGNSNFCIIDCGTAITVDYVIDNIHLGGLISPGLHTFSKSLNTSTDNINGHINDLNTNLFNYTSTSTSECISSASKILFKAFLENILAENKKNYGDNFVTYISGGYSHLFNNDANYNIIFCKNLILDGLFEVKKTF